MPLLVDNSVDNLPYATVFVLFVHTVHNRLVLIVQSRIIYSKKQTSTNRFT
jgi:hypothetical protein